MKIAGRYEIRAEIARGGSGSVHLARDVQSDRQVAIKVLEPSGENQEQLWRNEFAGLAGLAHPNLVSLLDVGRDPDSGRLFLVMEHIDGAPLSAALRGASEARALAWLRQAGGALAFIHSRGLLHRDLKPANLLVRTDGMLKIVDFGLAVETPIPQSPRAGTLVYLPPEVLEGSPPDARSDLYSLGLSFYHAVTSVAPFRSSDDPAELLQEIRKGAFPPAGGPPLPRSLEDVLRRLSSRRPQDRFSSAADLVRYLDLTESEAIAMEKIGPEPSSITAPRMVGRSQEIRRLSESLDTILGEGIVESAPPLILIGGEAGIGKSRLLSEFRRMAVSAGAETRLVSCPEEGRAPLYPFLQLLRSLLPSTMPLERATGPAAANAAAIFEETGRSFRDIDSPERHIPREKSRIFDRITGLLLQQASRSPLVVLIEDLHWADGASLELLSYLARNALGSRLLLIAAHRIETEAAEAFAEWLSSVLRREWSERLVLERLSEGEVREWLEMLFADAVIDQDFVRRLTRESSGNALFLLEILRSLEADGALVREPAGWRLPDAGSMSAHVPSDLAEALARRVGRVSEIETLVLGALAVLARPAGAEVLADLLDLSVDEAQAALHGLVARGLLVADSRGGGQHAFEHALVRREAEARLDDRLRRRLHRKAGELLEREAPGGPGLLEQLARHFARGGPASRAATYAERAGDAALLRHAGAEAARYYESAIRLEADSDAGARARRLLKAGNGWLAAGDYARARGHFETLLGLTDSLEDQAARAQALERLGTVLGFQRSGEEGVEMVREALSLFRCRGDLVGEARALHNLAIRHARQSRYAEALPLFHAALRVQEQRSDPAAMADERNSLGLVECFLGRYGAAADHLEGAFALASSVDYRYLMGAARHNLGIVRRSQGKPAEALEAAREALGIFEEIGHRNAFGCALLNVGLYSRAALRFEAALESFRKARSALARAGDASREVYALEGEADLLRYLGQPLTAIDRLGEAVRVAARASDERQRGYATAALSRALIDAGRPEEAADKARTALVIGERASCPRLVARSLVALSASALACGEPAQAAARARELFARASAGLPLEEMEAEANLIQTTALLQLGDLGGAREALERARQTIRDRALDALLPWADRLESALAQRSGCETEARSWERRAADGRRRLVEGVADETLRRSFQTAVSLEWPEIKDGPGAGAPSGASPLAALRTLYEIAGVVSSAHGLDELLDRVLDLALEAVGAARGLIILIAKSSGALEVRTSRAIEPETARDAARYSRNIVRAAGSGQAILSVDAEHDDRFSQYKSISLFRIKSLVCVPLRTRDGIIGTVYVDGGRDGRVFTQDDLAFLEAFASQAAIAIENARLCAALAEENRLLKHAAGERYQFQNLIGDSTAMRQVFGLMERAAASPFPVLIQGESGTGKELVARALHANSPRRARSFLSENCAAIPEPLLESELFGYVQGAFTGADRDKIGLYELADGGTLFLDEVGEMPMGMQVKLLRVLQDGEYRPIGSAESRTASVRILAATNADLKTRIAEGRFREDLYYRLNVISIWLPPLRNRKDDIPRLTEFFLEKAAREGGAGGMKMADDLLAVLVRHDWPGNVRQLENAINRLALLARSNTLMLRDLESDPQLFEQLVTLRAEDRAVEDLSTVERRQIQRALVETGGNRERAARLLGISRATIFRKIRDYGLR